MHTTSRPKQPSRPPRTRPSRPNTRNSSTIASAQRRHNGHSISQHSSPPTTAQSRSRRNTPTRLNANALQLTHHRHNFSSHTNQSSSPAYQSGNNIKLTKTQIEHLKSLQTPTGRFQSGSFIVEGRKLIEGICIGEGGFIRPKAVFLTAEQHGKIKDVVETSKGFTKQLKTTPLQSNTAQNTNTRDGLKVNADRNDLEALLATYRKKAFLDNSTQHPWVTRPNGTLAPPLSHSLDKTTELSDAQYQLYHYILTQGFVVESALLGRLSQFSSGPGILAEMNKLPNVNQFETASNTDNDLGTMETPKFGHADAVGFGQSTSSKTRTNTQTTWDWSRGGLILSGISDPGNLGTIIRSAHGFGVEQIVIIDGCDIYNAKAISASSAAISHVSAILSCTGTQFIDFMRKVQGKDQEAWGKVGMGGLDSSQGEIIDKINSLKLSQPYLVGLTPNRGLDLNNIPSSLSEHIINQLPLSSSLSPHAGSLTANGSEPTRGNAPWLVVGSEAFGLPAQIEQLLHCAATIPTTTDFVDSLNASVAASIGLYVIRKQASI